MCCSAAAVTRNMSVKFKQLQTSSSLVHRLIIKHKIDSLYLFLTMLRLEFEELFRNLELHHTKIRLIL